MLRLAEDSVVSVGYGLVHSLFDAFDVDFEIIKVHAIQGTCAFVHPLVLVGFLIRIVGRLRAKVDGVAFVLTVTL